MQSKQLEGIRSFDPEIAFLHFSSCQQALRRLDTRHQIIRQVLVYQGRVDTSLVRVAEVFREAVRENCAGLIAVHNHPSGDPTPSPEDVAVTKEIVAAGRLLSIEVLDHLVIGRQRYVSMRERGLGF